MLPRIYQPSPFFGTPLNIGNVGLTSPHREPSPILNDSLNIWRINNLNSSTSITLDYTLRDLFALDNHGEPHPTVFFYGKIPENEPKTSHAKFIYSDLKRCGFLAGNIPLVILTFDPPEQDQGLKIQSTTRMHTEVYKNFAQLHHSQQPVVSFATDPRHVALEPGSSLSVFKPNNFVSRLPHILDPEIHYKLESKPGLARSGLPSSSSLVIDPLIQPGDVHDSFLLEKEITRMMNTIDMQNVPFLVKLPHTTSGRGTFVVSSDIDRPQAKTKLSIWLRDQLPQINTANHHPSPSSLVIQEYVVGTEVALSIFLTRKGRPIFIACCVPRFNQHSLWAGGTIVYADQNALYQKHAIIVEKAAKYLHQKGYYGPAGIDIITDRSGKQYIMDINARITGSYHLGPLSGHFPQRGLSTAVSIKGYFTCSRPVFEETFHQEISDGCVIIVGWVYAELEKLSHGVIIMGGKDGSELEKLLKRIQAFVLS